MKITFLNEAGPFGSYKKVTTQSNLDKAKRELTREATLHILENKCDELAELFLDMLNEVNSKINEISSKYSYKFQSYGGVKEKTSNILELSNFVVNTYFNNDPRKKETQLNIIKNVYCNRPAVEYMMSKGCFILPLSDTTRKWSYYFDDSKEIIPYKNMTKAIADVAENVIKSHISKFPNYALVNIPKKVKIVMLNVYHAPYTKPSLSTLSCSPNHPYRQFFSCMGVNFTNDRVNFEYPVGQGSNCLNFILYKFTSLSVDNCNITLEKSNDTIWKAIAEPSPWMLNKITFKYVYTDLSTASANNFYAIKLLKSAVDNGLLIKTESYISILVDNVLKNIHLIKQIKQEVANNGLDHMVKYKFNDRSTYAESLTSIGKEITSKQAEKEGILTDSLKRRVYEFDYNDAAEVKSAAKDLISGCFKFLTDAKIKKIAEDKMEEYLPVLMSKVLATKPNCISSSNKILLCDYHQNGATGKSNIRVIIDPNKVEINKKNNLVFYIAVDFKLPVRGVNPKYNNRATRQNTGKNYEYITGNKIKIEIPL